MTKIAWDGICLSSGNLDNTNQEKIKKLIDNFGEALEEQCSKNNINKFVFPIFKPFNSFLAISKTKVIIIFSPASGMPNRQWHDLSDRIPEPTIHELAGAVQNQLGWTNLSFLEFPLNILDTSLEKRRPDLTIVASKWVDDVIKMSEKEQKIVRLNPIFHGRDFLIEDDLCFILMPFSEPFDTIYKKYIKPTVEKKFRIKRADTIFKSSEIIEDIWEYINKSKFIIADVTGKNANVFYELGMAHTVGKVVFIITMKKDDVPFDVKHRRSFEYSYTEQGLKKLKSDLKNAMNELT